MFKLSLGNLARGQNTQEITNILTSVSNWMIPGDFYLINDQICMDIRKHYVRKLVILP